MESLRKLEPMLEDLQSWRKAPHSQGITLIDYAGFVATPDLLGAFAAILHPKCIEHAGKYFLADRFDVANYESWMSKLGSQVDVQRVMNHIHIDILFQNQDLSDDVACACADVIRDAWNISLRSLGVRAESGGSDIGDAYVTFYG